MKDCTGACFNSSKLGDGICNNNFKCAALSFDNGDCSGCNAQTEIADCKGYCIDKTFLGDVFCDRSLNCSKWFYDNGTCLTTPASTTGNNQGACASQYVRDCAGNCQPQSFIGDRQCDDGRFGAVFNCPLFNCDNGDCDCSVTTGRFTTGRFTTGFVPFTTVAVTSGSLTSGVVPATTGVAPAATTAGLTSGAEITTGTAQNESSPSGTGLGRGAIIGIAIGASVGAIIIILIVVFVIISRRPSKYQLRAADMEGSGNVELDDHKKGTQLSVEKRGSANSANSANSDSD